ncbi:MAG TPA: NADH-quinone oxidoreductase subunit H [Microthrixaceae bacterium]|mgnify:CR=1 FL=1|jgi:NADH-quinone oxidoreductase subunit H|nr:NADH-quinone oxidoreductase subunit H [Microthrixaceae bacterium]
MFAVDPLLNDVDFNSVWITVLKVVVAFAGLLVSVIAMIWFERKLHADFSNRLGPRVAGPFGTLQTIADGMKLLFKADLLPDQADKFVYKLAPYLSMVPAFLTFVTIPIAGNFTDGGTGTVKIAGHDTLLQVADPQIGILFVLAMSSIAVYGIMLAGWSSGSKYPLLGSVRASAQMVSYEAALGLSLLCVLLNSGSLSTNAIVQSQSNWNWNLWATGIVPFVVFLIAGTAETNRPPFDLVEAEQELVGGFHTEFTAFRFAMFYVAEFMNVITMSAILVTLFLGGPIGPNFGTTGWVAEFVLPFIWFFLKVLALLVVFVLFRTTLPRLRYDQLMDLGWKLLIPLSLGWFLLLVAVKVGEDNDWNVALVLAIALVAMISGAALLSVAIRTSRYRRAEEKVGA